MSFVLHWYEMWSLAVQKSINENVRELNSMKQSPRNTKSSSARQKNSEHVMEPGCSLPCSQHPATVPALFQMNPVHAFPYCFLTIHFIIILPSSPRSSNRPRSPRFPHQHPACTSPDVFSSHTFHIPRSPYSSSLELTYLLHGAEYFL